MAEIRSPQKQSFINRPIGVARADTGAAQAAQDIARSASAYANTISNTVNAAFRAGTQLQQTYEQEKYVNWAKTTTILDENGQPKVISMPSALSTRTRSQVNDILVSRYTEANKLQTAELFTTLRSKYGNDVDGFISEASNTINERAKIIKDSGGLDYSQSYLADSTTMLAKHKLDIMTKNAQIADAKATGDFMTNVQAQVSEVAERIANAGGDIDFGIQDFSNIMEMLDSTKPYDMGMTPTGVVDFKNKLTRQFVMSSLMTQLSDKTSAEIIEVEKFLADGIITDTVRGVVGNIDTLSDYLVTEADKDYILAQVSKFQNIVSTRETNQASLAGNINSVDKKAQKASSIRLTTFGDAGINNEQEFIAALMDKNVAPELINFMQNSPAAPHYLVNAIEAIKDNNSVYNDEAIRVLNEAAYSMLFTEDGRLIRNGRGMSDESVSFVKLLQANFNRFGRDVSVGDLVVQASGKRNNEPAYRQFVAAKLGVEDSTKGNPNDWITKYLIDNTDYNAKFISRFAPVFGTHLVNSSLGDAEDFMDTFYESFNHKYKHSYTPEGGAEKQPYTPEYYYGADTSPTGGALKLLNFESHMQRKLNQLQTPLDLGDDVLLVSDPRNNDGFGTFWAVDRQGNRIQDGLGNDIKFTTKGFDAETNIEQRKRLEAEAARQAEAESLARAQRLEAMKNEDTSAYYP
jgi:hypothetical protein